MREPIPIACTLSPGARAGRMDEFRRLFADHLRAMSRPAATRLRLTLEGSDGVEATTRDLIAREQQCCAFYTFGVTAGGGHVIVEAQVPAGAEPVLDELAGIAQEAAPGLRGRSGPAKADRRIAETICRCPNR
jgi:hypothetical protein